MPVFDSKEAARQAQLQPESDANQLHETVMHEQSNRQKKLTPKQESFVAEYLLDGNGTRAALIAGYSPKTAYQIAHENLRKPEIVAAIRRAQRETRERLEITRDDVVNGLHSIATDDGNNPSARVSAWTGIAKVLGYVEDRVRHEGEIERIWKPGIGPLDEETKALAELGRGLLDGRVVMGEAREVEGAFPLVRRGGSRESQ